MNFAKLSVYRVLQILVCCPSRYRARRTQRHYIKLYLNYYNSICDKCQEKRARKNEEKTGSPDLFCITLQ